jgi:hypothetical protein
MKADTPLEILMWLDRHAQRVEFEHLAPVFRDKTRVVLYFRDPSTGAIEVVALRPCYQERRRATCGRLPRPSGGESPN